MRSLLLNGQRILRAWLCRHACVREVGVIVFRLPMHWLISNSETKRSRNREQVTTPCAFPQYQPGAN